MRTVSFQRVVLLTAASGGLWSIIALVLGGALFGRIIWGGVAIAPFVGVAMGFASVKFPSNVVQRSLFSLFSLYVAAALFGVGMGTYDVLVGQSSGVGWRRIPSGVILQAVLATLWGITFTGYLVILWPLTYANHHLLSRVWLRVKSR